MGRHDTPSGSEDEAPAPAAPPAVKQEVTAVDAVVKKETLEIVGLDGEQALQADDKEHALRRALLARLDDKVIKSEHGDRRSRTPDSGEHEREHGRDRDRDRDRGRDGDRNGRERRKRRWESPEPAGRERRSRWDDSESSRSMSTGGGGRPNNAPPPRAGDWACPKCGANVFASKNECFKCRTPKPPVAFAPGGYGEGGTGAAQAAAAAAEMQTGRSKGRAFTGDPTKPLIPKLAERKTSEWAQLPVLEYRKTIIDMVKTNQVIVLTGETGSGKTTQIPQYLAAEMGWNGRIGVTQPRRVAAVSVAKRVAEEVGVEAGQEVGYAIRFEDITGANTAIKFLTDGILLREILSDRLLSSYAFVMLDEAHERSLHTDILFALMKEVLLKRPEFRLMVCSATLDTSKFSDYFFKAPMLDVPGRTFPVDIQYIECNRYVDKVMELVDQLHVEQPVEHHILVFLTGEDEIIRACQGAHKRILQRQQDGEEVAGMRICPLHSSLPVEFYQRVFDEPPEGTRKLVVATNIAETSITVPGIKYVIDCGAVKQKIFNAESGMESLNIMPISKPAAKQRAGRAGRTGPGVAIRLYSEKRMEKEFPLETVPEILRTNLSSTILTLKGMGIKDPVAFDYMDAPDTDKIVAGLRMLYLFGALDADGEITSVGRDMALFPLEPALSRMLLASILHKCADDMVTLVALVAVDGGNIFYRPTMKEEQAIATAAKQRFYDADGDYAGLLRLYKEWAAAGGVRNGLHWAKANYVHSRAMCRAADVRDQLLGIMRKFDMPIVAANRPALVGRAIAESLYMNAARRGSKNTYETLAEGRMVSVHSGSLLAPFDKDDWAELVVCLEMVWTSGGQMRFVCAAQAKWVMDLLPKIETVDIKRLCGGRIIVKKKERDIGNQDKRAAEAAKADVKKSDTEVGDAKARFLARKAARAGGGK